MDDGKKKNEVVLSDSAEITVVRGGIRVEFNANGSVVVYQNDVPVYPATNDIVPQATAAVTAKEALEVGDRLPDGSVVLSVDLEKNEALFLPAAIFGGKAEFDHQDDVVQGVNKDGLHGHKDWRRISDAEGKTLSQVWKNVASPKLQSSDAPSFWLPSADNFEYGRVRRGGEADWHYFMRVFSLPVPVVRSGPARSLDT